MPGLVCLSQRGHRKGKKLWPYGERKNLTLRSLEKLSQKLLPPNWSLVNAQQKKNKRGEGGGKCKKCQNRGEERKKCFLGMPEIQNSIFFCRIIFTSGTEGQTAHLLKSQTVSRKHLRYLQNAIFAKFPGGNGLTSHKWMPTTFSGSENRSDHVNMLA